MRRRLVLVLPALLAGCASPAVEWVRLLPVPGQPRATPPCIILLRDLRLAAELDRPGPLHAAGGSRVMLPGRERWAAPLEGMAGHVLLRDLAQRLPACVLRDAEAPAMPAAAAPLEAVIDIALDRFEAGADGQAWLEAEATLFWPSSPTRPPRALRVERRMPPDGPGPEPLARALSAALAQLADALAGLLAGALAGTLVEAPPPPTTSPSLSRKDHAG
ncbi:PqiC family protein [Roseomonas sp. GC11]|uniref:ABC-type transport auxiliary lipoprotein family protein n=1 Tax=Roseomonas sp. GC11 TaxID=2950546 RepID=UPI00210F21A2|nr:ABC-type transport auxiliary lipoprotein family protein [Roseomonas sp. GC11]MCQ4158812.1 PqiC family protein [Roseomonas sp. GC11]